MEVIISIETNALGSVSGKVIRIPVENFPEGEPVVINGWLPSHYQPYVKRIAVIRNGTELTLDTEYKPKHYNVAPYGVYTVREIGLSYAYCSIDIRLE